MSIARGGSFVYVSLPGIRLQNDLVSIQLSTVLFLQDHSDRVAQSLLVWRKSREIYCSSFGCTGAWGIVSILQLHRSWLIVFISFKGNDVTFETFPGRAFISQTLASCCMTLWSISFDWVGICHLLRATHPSLRVESRVFPMYQTRGELVRRYRLSRQVMTLLSL